MEILPFHICLRFDVYFLQTHCDFCLSAAAAAAAAEIATTDSTVPNKFVYFGVFLIVFITRKNVSLYIQEKNILIQFFVLTVFLSPFRNNFLLEMVENV